MTGGSLPGRPATTVAPTKGPMPKDTHAQCNGATSRGPVSVELSVRLGEVSHTQIITQSDPHQSNRHDPTSQRTNNKSRHYHIH